MVVYGDAANVASWFLNSVVSLQLNNYNRLNRTRMKRTP